MQGKGGPKMKNFKKQFVDLFDLPAEIVLDLPLLMMVGQQSLYLENHKGITLYQKDKIKVRFNKGSIIFSGKDLTIKEFQSEDLYISGQINEINFERR